jgi:hypothetical protein
VTLISISGLLKRKYCWLARTRADVGVLAIWGDLAAGFCGRFGKAARASRPPRLQDGAIFDAVIVTAKDAHDFCVVAATIIPVLVLTRFIGEHTPFEVAGSFMKQEAENIEADIEKIEADIEKIESGMASLEGQLAQEQRTRSAWRFLHLGQGKRFWNDKRRYSQAELSEVQSEVSTLREMMEEAKRYSRRAHLKVPNTTKLDTTFGLAAIVLTICAGIIGEFTSLMGVLGVIDRNIAISIPVICINVLLFLLAVFALARFIIGPEALEYTRVRIVAYGAVHAVPLILITWLRIIILTKLSYTP